LLERRSAPLTLIRFYLEYTATVFELCRHAPTDCFPYRFVLRPCAGHRKWPRASKQGCLRPSARRGRRSNPRFQSLGTYPGGRSVKAVAPAGRQRRGLGKPPRRLSGDVPASAGPNAFAVGEDAKLYVYVWNWTLGARSAAPTQLSEPKGPARQRHEGTGAQRGTRATLLGLPRRPAPQN